MGAFIVAAIVLIAACALAFFWGFAESMATAPQYDNTPLHILVGGGAIAACIIATHWMPHIGW